MKISKEQVREALIRWEIESRLNVQDFVKSETLNVEEFADGGAEYMWHLLKEVKNEN